MPGAMAAAVVFSALAGRVAVPPRPDSTAPIVANTNRVPSGRLVGRTLTLHLVARAGRWCPEEADGLCLTVAAFGVEGGPPTNPGPLIRVRQGTGIRATVRNDLDGATLVVRGLGTRPGAATDTLQVRAGATREVRFQAGAPGTYFYWGSTTGAASIERRRGSESQLAGAFVVDPATGPVGDDHVFVMSVFEDTLLVAGTRDKWEIVAINGRSYPHDEAFTFTVGDSVRWRWINASDRLHPMHLHGFYYRVDSRGDAERDTLYAPGERRQVVTERMWAGTTMRMAWSPDRPGFWIFHCHIVYHILPGLHLPRDAGDTAPPGLHMAGLVVAMQVRPAPGAGPRPAPADTQFVRLLVQARPRVYGTDPGYGYVVQSGTTEPAPDSIAIPGMPIVLTRGRLARITVVNHLSEPTAVHWHGMELESFYDGIPDMSGEPGHLMPMIAAADSFVAEMTPPRAGTFIYHTHAHDDRQLSLGLYGPLLVLEPGERYEPATDHVIVLGIGGLGDSATFLVNGSRVPAPLSFQAGVRQRLRFIALPTFGAVTYEMRRDSTLERWQPLGKDGADLPPWQTAEQPARVMISVGEAYDFLYLPAAAGPLRLEVRSALKNRHILTMAALVR